jgi:erythritol kinase
MARTWTDVAATLRELGDKVPGLASRTAGIAVTAQGDGLWLIDSAGEPVAPAWLWLDVRATDIADAVVARPDYHRHYETTGTALNACQQSVQIAWMKREQPEVLARAGTALHCKDWLYFKLTGERVTDPSEASFTYGDFRTRDYAPEVIARFGIEAEARLLPPIVDGASKAHPLTARAAAETGLRQGTPVVLGYLDVICVALGAGLLSDGANRGCSVLGSTGMHMRLARSAGDVVLNPGQSGYTMPFPGTRMVAQMQSNMAASLNVDWLAGIVCDELARAGVTKTRESLLSGLDEAVLAAPPAACVFHPYISPSGERGPFLDRNARAQFVGLSQEMKFPALLRAVFEGLALAARDCYAAMGAIPHEIHVAGGVARSRAVRSILAAALGAPVRTMNRDESGAAGAAMIAAVSLGIYPDMPACAAAWCDPSLGPFVEPDPALVGVYDELFAVYRDLRHAVQPSWKRLAALRDRSAP